MGFLSIKVDRKSKASALDSAQPSPTLPRPIHNPFNDSNAPSTAASSENVSLSESAGIRASARKSRLDIVKTQVMINYLYQQQGNNGWRSESNVPQGVVLRLSRESYLTYPPQLEESELADSLRDLNVQSAMTIHSPAIKTYLAQMPDVTDIPLLNGLAVQVIPNIEALARARTYQFAAVVASEASLVVWDDDATNLLARGKKIEWELMQLLWTAPDNHSKMSSKIDLRITEKEIGDSDSDLELAAPKPRPTIFINTILVSLSLCCIIATLGLGLRQLVIELQIDIGGTSPTSPYIRFAFLAFTPVWLFFGMFFFNVLITNIAECIGPIQQMNINSKHYSAVTVPRLTRNLPHVTIQCPVYKESLSEVIQPTIVSIKKAMSTYELQGGSANIFVNDDGLQLISEEDRDKRMAFYADNGIGWVARPAHSKEPGGFQRKGKFKKASNMNFAMDISCKMEDKLVDLKRTAAWSSVDEAEATAWALDQAIEETNGTAWADGNIRMGDYILISK